MDHRILNLDDLSAQLGRDRRELDKLAQRGQIPGRKVAGQWQFDSSEITQWLEQQIRGYSTEQLAALEESQQSSEIESHIPVSTLLKPETVQVPLEARTKRSALEGLIEVAGRTWQVWEPAALLQAVLQREEVLSTAFDNGVAIPHPRTPLPQALGESIIAFGRTYSGIPFGGPKRSLTDMFFLVLCRDSRTHLLALARLGRMLQLPDFVDELRSAPDSASAYEVICRADQKVAES
jgi:PTS system nitrogen regulatory IIA component